jgi:N-acetylglucosamine kinase-like BadF-type ATPase
LNITNKTRIKTRMGCVSPGAGSSLILGVDGGGSKTAALIARSDDKGVIDIIGRGFGGPSNLQLAGKERSLTSLNQAIGDAMQEAGINGQKLDCAVLALAGSTSPDVQGDISKWASQRELSSRVEIVHDVAPVLASGTEDGCGIALIVGTGSVAVGVDSDGQSVIKGGWGHWFGDKGSGFYLGYRALAAVAEASDEIGPETILSEMVMDTLGTTDPRRILAEVTSSGDTRREVAALAPIVLDAAAKGDAVSRRIVNAAIKEASKLVAAVAKALGLKEAYQLAIAGGVICSSQFFQDQLIASLQRLQPSPGKVTLVEEPVLGCLKIASTHMANLVE